MNKILMNWINYKHNSHKINSHYNNNHNNNKMNNNNNNNKYQLFLIIKKISNVKPNQYYPHTI